VAFIEKRAYFRVSVECDIEYRVLPTEEIKTARCITLSGGGISFLTTQPLSVQDELEITIASPAPLTSPMIAHAKVVRTVAREDELFEVGAVLIVIHA